MIMTKFINATPHDIKVMDADGAIVIYPKEVVVFRCEETRVSLPPITTDKGAVINVSTVTYGEVLTNDGSPIPPFQEGTMYIVSALVRQGAPDRTDFVSPGTLIRDATGQPIGCQGFSR